MNNIYLIGMCVSMVLFLLIGFFISRKVKNKNDFYVAGRKAPVLLIAGSLIASYTSTGVFMGDAATFYDGGFSAMILLSGMQVAGYILGAVIFGRYLRRSQVYTIPEFFGKRFCSTPMRKLSAVTAIVTMVVYLLSTIQGIGTLMSVVTKLDYRICVIIATAVFMIICILSGSRGVLITDTLMALLFTLAAIVSVIVIASKNGGWFTSIDKIANDESLKGLLSWGGRSGALYDDGISNVVWGIIYGVVWMSVCMAGPWQSSRYLMAKNESTVINSSFIAAIGIFVLEFFIGMAAVFVNLNNPEMGETSHVMIWAAMNILPTFLGVLLLTGVLSAGISSATTFLSLIGSSVANDFMVKTGAKNDKTSILISRISMLIAGCLVLVLSLVNSPAIFWIVFFGGAIIASSWMPVTIASIVSKRVTKTGAFCGMLTGFVSCFVLKMISFIAKITLPVYLDPSFVGIILNVVAIIIGSACTKVTEEEKQARQALFVTPQTEINCLLMRKTLKNTKWSILIGVFVLIVLVAFWAIPYLVSVN